MSRPNSSRNTPPRSRKRTKVRLSSRFLYPASPKESGPAALLFSSSPALTVPELAEGPVLRHARLRRSLSLSKGRFSVMPGCDLSVMPGSDRASPAPEVPELVEGPVEGPIEGPANPSPSRRLVMPGSDLSVIPGLTGHLRPLRPLSLSKGRRILHPPAAENYFSVQLLRKTNFHRTAKPTHRIRLQLSQCVVHA